MSQSLIPRERLLVASVARAARGKGLVRIHLAMRGRVETELPRYPKNELKMHRIRSLKNEFSRSKMNFSFCVIFVFFDPCFPGIGSAIALKLWGTNIKLTV